MVTTPLCQVIIALSICGAQRSRAPARGHTARTPSSIYSFFFFLGLLLLRVGKITPLALWFVVAGQEAGSFLPFFVSTGPSLPIQVASQHVPGKEVNKPEKCSLMGLGCSSVVRVFALGVKSSGCGLAVKEAPELDLRAS